MCAYYDLGGEGIAYHDSDPENHGSGHLNPLDGSYLNEFRKDEGVDTSYTKFRENIDRNPFNRVQPPDGLLYVGWTEPGEWFNLTVDVAEAGAYLVDILYTSNRGATLALDLNFRPLASKDIELTSTFDPARKHSMAKLAPLECLAGGRGGSSGGKERPHRAHTGKGECEPCLSRFSKEAVSWTAAARSRLGGCGESARLA